MEPLHSCRNRSKRRRRVCRRAPLRDDGSGPFIIASVLGGDRIARFRFEDTVERLGRVLAVVQFGEFLGHLIDFASVEFLRAETTAGDALSDTDAQDFFARTLVFDLFRRRDGGTQSLQRPALSALRGGFYLDERATAATRSAGNDGCKLPNPARRISSPRFNLP